MIGVTFILLVMRLLLLLFECKVDNLLLRFDVFNVVVALLGEILVLLFFVVDVLLLFVVVAVAVVGEKSSSNCRLADINGS